MVLWKVYVCGMEIPDR